MLPGSTLSNVPASIFNDHKAMQMGHSQSPIDLEFTRLINEADKHVSDATAQGLAFGLDVLGDIVLPPSAAAQVDRAQMRALGALYLAADLEPARIIASVELLARLAATGAISLDLGSSAELLHKFWKKRNERLDAMERIAFFGRLFGSSYGVAPADGLPNKEFEKLMLELCEALYRLDELSSDRVYGGIAQQSRLRVTARNLISNLIMAGGGVTAFFATEILRVLKEALAILTHKQLRGIFMARDIWGVITAINRLAGIKMSEPRSFVRRGRAGMNAIVWLADASTALGEHGKPLVRLDHPVVSAAVEWLQASLTISEDQDDSSNTASPSQSDLFPNQASQWANIGG